MALAFLLGITLTANAAYTANVVYTAYVRFAMLAAVIAILTAGQWLFCRKHGTGRIRCCMGCLLTALALLLGWHRCLREEMFRESYRPFLEEGARLSVQGQLEKKEQKNGQYIYYLSSCLIGQGISCHSILVYSDADVASVGEILVLDGTVELWKSAVNEGNFDEKTFYEARGICARLKDIQLKAVCGKADRWKEELYGLRIRMEHIYSDVMGEQAGGVISTMALGDKSALDDGIKQLYQMCGISHILAISGLHISVIGMSLYRLLMRFKLGKTGAGLLSGVLIYAYGTMTGMGTSVKRAAFMFALMLIAQTVGRSYDTLNALGAAALWILWQNPGMIADAGFQFSFAAVIGIAWVGGRMQQSGGITSKLWGNIAIQLATLPMAAWYYFEIPIYAIPVNILVLPMMGCLLAFGLFGGLAGLLSDRLAVVLLFPCRVLLAGIDLLCGQIADWPGAMLITGRPKLWTVILYYILLVWVVYLIHKRQKEKRKTACCRMIAVSLLLLLVMRPQGGFELDILDVGQGDGSYIRTDGGHHLFVDGGSSNVGKVGEYRILPFLKAKGVRRIDYWFVSHADSDHISGLTELLMTGYPVRCLVLTEYAVKEDEETRKLAESAREAGTEILYVRQGDVLHFGTAAIRILSPMDGELYEDRNSASMVFLYEEGDFSGIFTGDIDAASEQKLLEGLKMDGIDFYKAAHHGSDHSNSEPFLQTLSPAVSAISCGLKNSYGHPGEEAVKHIEQSGSRIFYTMEAGQIRLTVRRGQIAVQKYREPGKVYICETRT